MLYIHTRDVRCRDFTHVYIHTRDVRRRDFTHVYIHTRDVRRRDFTASYVTGIFSREDLDDATVYHGCMISHKFS